MFQLSRAARRYLMKCTITTMFLFSILAVSSHAQPLIGHWTFDETSGNTAFDSVAGGTNGAIGSNVTLGVPGVVGTAFSFPGENSQDGIVDFGNAPSVLDPILFKDKMSVSAWFNWTDNPVARSVGLSIASDTTNQNFIDLGFTGSAPTPPAPPVFPNGRRFNTEGGVYGGINISGRKTEIVNTTGFNDNTGAFPGGGELVTAIPPGSGTALNDGQWHHVALTVDAATDHVELFVDGVSVGVATATSGGDGILNVGDFQSTMDNFEVGRLGRMAACCQAGAGTLVDDIQIYQRALTAGEVNSLFQNPGSVVVPEPASLALAGLSGLLLLRRRCRTWM